MADYEKEKIDRFLVVHKDLSIYYNGIDITAETFIKQYSGFVRDNMFCDNHNILITMHNGSPIYDAIMLVSDVLALISMNNITHKDIVDQLSAGQMVCHGHKQERIEFVGKADIPGYYEFKAKGGLSKKITLKSVSTVIPYYGNAKVLGTIGAGDQHTSLKFQKEVLGYTDDVATSFVATSVIMVSDHSYFNSLLDSILIRYKDNSYKITDLLAISFFTDENESQYSGNSNKLEANIKVTSTMSTARDLLFKKNENEIIGFSVFGNKGVKNTIGELEDALKRKKIAFSTINYNISEDIDCLFGLLNDDNLNSPKIYATTKDFLLSFYLGIKNSKGCFKEFDYSCNRIIDKQIQYQVVPSNINWKELIKIYDLLRDLRVVAGGEEKAEKFVIEAYGILRLILSAIVPLQEFEKKEGIDIEYVTPQEKMTSLRAYAPLSDNILQLRNRILPYIEKVYNNLYEDNPKANYLSKSIKRTNKTVILVEKAYYKPIIERYYSKRGLANVLSVNTESKAKEIQCDELYISGKQNVANIMNWNTASEQKYVLYDGEYRLFLWNLKQYQNKMNCLNHLSYFYVDKEESFVEELNDITDEVAVTITKIDEIENLEKNFLIQNAILHSSSFSGDANVIPAEITRVAVCESGESIYFTKYYKAFVLDVGRSKVKEVETKEIKNGDSLIFTINNGQTKDIAELVLTKYAKNSKNAVLTRAMQDVSDWKSHLNIIKEENNYTYSDMSKLFERFRYRAEPQTIRSWLDPDCHVMGPINEKAYYAMAEIFKNEELFEEFSEDTTRFIGATQLVRTQRTEILGVIASVIVAKYSGISLKLDDAFNGVVAEEITLLSVLKRISQIKDVDPFTVPNSKANKPIII